ncbi:MAG: hypothetical protein CSA24_00085 [Deltaproteobacteria bacterium]|nr:MAG: hypothetical protein CSA24_00085 [Deltaproteobacteria bacterium]
MKHELEVAIALAREAGAAIEQVRRAGFEARHKSDRSPVTAADLAADKILREGLTAAFPADGLLTEESGWVAPPNAHRAWVIDPLDGTNAFVDGAIRGYAVQVGLLVDGAPRLGVVFEPRFDRLFYAVAGQGAWLATGGAAPTRLRVSAHAKPSEMPVVTSTTMPAERRQRLLDLGFPDGGRLRSVGIKVGELVTGRADIYVSDHPVKYWDSCAPMIILTEAGGQAAHVDGRPMTYVLGGQVHHDGGAFYMSNGPRHEAVGEALRAAWDGPW